MDAIYIILKSIKEKPGNHYPAFQIFYKKITNLIA